MLLLTSFKESRNIRKYSALKDVDIYSVARWQPAGFHYTELSFLFAQDIYGEKLSLRGKPNPLVNYKKDLTEYYKSMWNKGLGEWLVNLSNDNKTILCCWCPHASHSKAQMETFGTFVCHTGFIGNMVNKFRPDIRVYMDYDHSVYLEESFKPTTYTKLIL